MSASTQWRCTAKRRMRYSSARAAPAVEKARASTPRQKAATRASSAAHHSAGCASRSTADHASENRSSANAAARASDADSAARPTRPSPRTDASGADAPWPPGSTLTRERASPRSPASAASCRDRDDDMAAGAERRAETGAREGRNGAVVRVSFLVRVCGAVCAGEAPAGARDQEMWISCRASHRPSASQPLSEASRRVVHHRPTRVGRPSLVCPRPCALPPHIPRSLRVLRRVNVLVRTVPQISHSLASMRRQRCIYDEASRT